MSLYTIKINTLASVCFIALAGIVGCSSEPESTALPDCDYSTQMRKTAQIQNFIWREEQHPVFHEDWQKSSLLEVAKRYQYLQRKSLADAVKAKNELLWLESKLNDLENINNSLLTQMQMNLCDNRHFPQSVVSLQQQNSGIANLLAGLADISDDVQAKAQKIISAAESR